MDHTPTIADLLATITPETLTDAAAILTDAADGLSRYPDQCPDTWDPTIVAVRARADRLRSVAAILADGIAR